MEQMLRNGIQKRKRPQHSPTFALREDSTREGLIPSKKRAQFPGQSDLPGHVGRLRAISRTAGELFPILVLFTFITGCAQKTNRQPRNVAAAKLERYHRGQIVVSKPELQIQATIFLSSTFDSFRGCDRALSRIQIGAPKRPQVKSPKKDSTGE